MSLSSATMSVRYVAETAIIDIQGEMNAFAENQLMDAFNQVVGAGARNILLNFSKLDYMNSSGIGLLVTMLIRARRQNVRVLACGLTEHYRQIFELTRLNEAIAVYDNEEVALEAIKVAA
jgi:anti-sigma B factor antagonist